MQKNVDNVNKKSSYIYMENVEQLNYNKLSPFSLFIYIDERSLYIYKGLNE
jgi:hypothetical protein